MLARISCLFVAVALGIVACAVTGSGSVAGGPEGATVRSDTGAPDVDVRALERSIHEEVNRVRRRRDLPELALADSMRELALVHSRDMAERDFFAHENPGGEGVNDRADRLGLTCARSLNDSTRIFGFGENLYSASLYESYRDRYRGDEFVGRSYDWKTPEQIVDGVVTGWMNSPGHRANLLDPRYRYEATAIVTSDDTFWVTQVFC